MQLELRFFTAALGGDGGPGNGRALAARCLPSAVIVDFDETLTTADTTALIIDAIVQAAAERQKGATGEALVAARGATRDALVARLLRERDAVLASSLPADPQPDHNAAAAAAFSAALSAFDREANARAFGSGLLAGAPIGTVEAAGTTVGRTALRPGAAAALTAALERGLPVRVLSVSWSASFVAAALRSAGVPAIVAPGWPPQAIAAEDGGAQGSAVVYANELRYGADGLTTGEVQARCECADDKAAAFAALTAGLASPGREPPFTVCVGDSPSDVGALLAARTGVIVGTSATMARVLQGLGVTVKPLAAGAHILCVVVGSGGWDAPPRTFDPCPHAASTLHIPSSQCPPTAGRTLPACYMPPLTGTRSGPTCWPTPSPPTPNRRACPVSCL